VEFELAGETEELGENVPQCHFVHKFHMTRPGLEPGPPQWEAGDLPPELWHGLQIKAYKHDLFSVEHRTHLEILHRFPA
jgi:hypothetical protein